MIKRIAFVLALVGVGAIAVGCSKPSGETTVQNKAEALWAECESKSDKNDLSCLELRQLGRENPGLIIPAANEKADKLIRQSELLGIEGRETMKKMDAEMKEFCKDPINRQHPQSPCN